MNIWKALWRGLLNTFRFFQPGPERDYVRQQMRSAAEKYAKYGK